MPLRHVIEAVSVFLVPLRLERGSFYLNFGSKKLIILPQQQQQQA